METVNNGIKKTVVKAPIEVSRVYKGMYQKPGSLTAEMKQTVTTKTSYPSKSVANNLQDNLFDAVEDFGYETKDYENSSTRVAWIPVPENMTLEQIKAKVSSDKCGLQQIMSNRPILSDNQKYGIESGVTDMETIANSQVLRYPQGATNNEGEDVSNQLILDRETGKPIYRVNVFKLGEVEDLDHRNSDPEDFYVTEDIRNEMAEEKGVDASSDFFKQ